MSSAARHCFQCIAILLIYGMSIGAASFAGAQSGVGVGSSRPEAETRRTPYKMELRGFLNTKPAPDALAVIELGLTGFRGQYQLEVTHAGAPDLPRITSSQILKQVWKRDVDLDVTGPRPLLAKIGQAQPGTPLALIGWFHPRDRQYRLDSVKIIGFE